LGAKAGRIKYLLCGLVLSRKIEVQKTGTKAGRLAIQVGAAYAADIDGLCSALCGCLPGSLSLHDDQRDTAVIDQAVVVQMQRFRNVSATEVVFHGNGLAHDGIGI